MAEAADREIAFVDDHIARSLDVMRRTADSTAFRDQVLQVARLCTATLRAGGKIMLAGNGGSAADAQHIAGEFLSRLNFDRAPLAAIALTTDTSVLTAVGNDFGFDKVFERQVRGLGRAGDVFIGISTSGHSASILGALAAARTLGIATVGFGGEGETPMVSLCDHMVQAPSTATPLIQQVHIMAAHAICGLVETNLFRS